MLVEPASVGGQLALKFQGREQRLIAKGQVSDAGSVTVEDGTTISYWVILHRVPNPVATARGTGRGTVVLLHPLMMSKSWFFSLGQKLADNGWDVVLPDLRGHGESTGKYITWGAREKGDIKAVMDSLLARKIVSNQIYVCGASLGGCVAVQYAAYDSRCRGCLALCPPASFRQIAPRILPFVPQGELLDARIKFAGEIAGFDPDDASAIKAAGKLRCPLILVHGQWDAIVPYQHSEAIFGAAHQPKQLILQPWKNHATVQIGQDDWLVEQIESLSQMGRG